LNTQVGRLSHSSLFSTSTLRIFQPCPAGNLIDESFTSFDLSPKIALSNLSSGESSCSHFGVIFHTRMEPPSTLAPTLTIPSTSKSLSFEPDTFGISSVVCSGQSLVSLTSSEYSLI